MKKFIYCSFIFFFSTSLIYSQASDYISSVRIGDAKEKLPVSVAVDLIAVDNIAGLNLVFKSFGENEYRKVEMVIAGNTASGTIPSEFVIPPYLDYYLLIDLKEGSPQTYPVGVEQGITPFQIIVSALSGKDQEILILSPNDGEMVSQDEILISISFFKAPDQVDINKTKIFLNNEDVSSQALIAGDLIVLSGDGISTLSSGSKLLKVEVFDKEGNLYHTIRSSFQIVTMEVAAAVSSRWKSSGNIRGESRTEYYNSISTWYNNISADVSASYEKIKMNGYAYITTEEKNNIQPYNRYSAALQASDWFELRVGDSYPRFQNLIMDGKRIRGISGFLNLGFFNVAAAFGQTVRKVEGILLEKFSANQAPLSSDVIPINQIKYGSPFGRVNLGTYNRDLFVVRPSFGSGENFQWGFTYLHSKDDPKSIEFGTRPQENVVVGSDFKLAFDDQNFMITYQGAISIFNKNISSGTLTDAQIDSIFGQNGIYDIDPADVKKYRDYLKDFITVNQFLGPLNPEEFSSVAGEAALNLNYFNNSLKASYIYRGNDYLSFGQSFIRTDVKGINIIDRIRMFDNKLFLSVGYESLVDNLQRTKPAKTTYNTMSASISIFPRTDFPNITIGLNISENNNGLNISDPVNKNNVVDDLTNRILFQLSYDLLLGVKHSTSLSFTTQNREDNSLSNTDAKYNAAGLTINSFWNSKLSSILQLLYSSSEIAAQPFDYFTITVGGKLRMLDNKLQLSATLSPSFGDFNRQAIEFLADYNIVANLNLAFQARLYRVPDKSTNSIIGLVTRFIF